MKIKGRRGVRVHPDQREARRHDILDMLVRYTPNTAIYDFMRKNYGIEPRMTRNYMREVRDEMAKVGVEFSAPQMRIERRHVFEGMKATILDCHAAGNVATAIRGYRELGRMLGLYTDKVEITGTGGEPIQVTVDAARLALAQRLAKLAKKKDGE